MKKGVLEQGFSSLKFCHIEKWQKLSEFKKLSQIWYIFKNFNSSPFWPTHFVEEMFFFSFFSRIQNNRNIWRNIVWTYYYTKVHILSDESTICKTLDTFDAIFCWFFGYWWGLLLVYAWWSWRIRVTMGMTFDLLWFDWLLVHSWNHTKK